MSAAIFLLVTLFRSVIFLRYFDHLVRLSEGRTADNPILVSSSESLISSPSQSYISSSSNGHLCLPITSSPSSATSTGPRLPSFYDLPNTPINPQGGHTPFNLPSLHFRTSNDFIPPNYSHSNLETLMNDTPPLNSISHTNHSLSWDTGPTPNLLPTISQPLFSFHPHQTINTDYYSLLPPSNTLPSASLSEPILSHPSLLDGPLPHISSSQPVLSLTFHSPPELFELALTAVRANRHMIDLYLDNLNLIY